MSTSSEESLKRTEEINDYFRRRYEMSKRPMEDKLSEFSEQAIQILILSPDCLLTFPHFISMYEREFERQLFCSDYKCESFTDLFNKMPEIFRVTHKHIDYEGIPRGGLVQLSDSVRRDATANREKKMKNHPKLLLFEKELVQLRNVMQGRRITIVDLSNLYGRHFRRPFKAANYGFASFKHMLEFLPHFVKIEDTKPHAIITWVPPQQSTKEDTESDKDASSDEEANSDEGTKSEEDSESDDEDNENEENTKSDKDTENDEDTENDDDTENNDSTESDDQDADTELEETSTPFANKCEEVTDKSELMADFCEECVELLMAMGNRSMRFRDFPKRYFEHFDKQCRATDYGFEDFEDLLGAIPGTVKIIEDRKSRYVPPHLRDSLHPGRMVKLTKSAALSGLDCPELCKEMPESQVVVDVQEEGDQDEHKLQVGNELETDDSVESGEGEEKYVDDVQVSGMEVKAAIDLIKEYFGQFEDSKLDVDSLKLGDIDRFVTKRNVATLKQTTLTRFFKK